jgi:hypothetical protein
MRKQSGPGERVNRSLTSSPRVESNRELSGAGWRADLYSAFGVQRNLLLGRDQVRILLAPVRGCHSPLGLVFACSRDSVPWLAPMRGQAKTESVSSSPPAK